MKRYLVKVTYLKMNKRVYYYGVGCERVRESKMDAKTIARKGFKTLAGAMRNYKSSLAEKYPEHVAVEIAEFYV